MALHSDHSSDDRPDLLEELIRFGLVDRQRDRPRDNAPQMPVPELDRTEGGVLPQMPMAAPPGGFNPMQMGGGGGPNIFDIFRQSQNTKYVGGYDPLAAGGQGINWNIGRQGQTGPAGAK